MATPSRFNASILARLPEQLSNPLFASAKPVKLPAGESLFMSGDTGDGCYRIEDGLLKVSILSPGGTERILAILGAGALVGELSIIDGLPRSATVTALKDTALAFISKATFEDYAERHPEVYRYLVAVLSARLRETDEVVAASSFLPLKGRLAVTLIELADHFGKDVGQGRVLIRHKFSQTELAAMAGIARENVSRILNDWKRRSLVSRVSGYYCLEDKAKIEQEIDL